MQGAALDEHLYVGSLAADARRLRGRDRARRSVPPPSELALIKWRDVVNGPATVLEDVTACRRRRSRSAGCCSTTRGRRATASSRFDPSQIPDPGGLIRQVHALGVKFMLWVSPRATCAARLPRQAARGARPPGARPARPGRRRRVPAADPRSSSRSAVDGVKADRGDENDLQRRRPGADERLPAALRRGGDGRAAEGGSRRSSAPRRSARRRSCRASGPATSPQEFVGLQRAIVAGADGGDERLPDLGLGRRRLRRRRRATTPSSSSAGRSSAPSRR